MADGHGGKRDGAGRKPNWLKERCQEIVERDKILEFLASVANGADVEQAVGGEGEVIRVPAAVRDRIKAAELLLDRGFGKAPQSMEVTGADGDPLSGIPTDAVVQLIEAIRQRTPGGSGEKS